MPALSSQAFPKGPVAISQGLADTTFGLPQSHFPLLMEQFLLKQQCAQPQGMNSDWSKPKMATLTLKVIIIYY